jgi:hypothetical protein
MRVYEVRPRSDKRGVDLISETLPFGRLWYGEPNAVSNAIEYATFRSRSHDAVISVYNEADNVIQTLRRAGDVQAVVKFFTRITAHFPLKRISMIPFSPGDSRRTRAGLDGMIPSISR